jgi:hypothetical protein
MHLKCATSSSRLIGLPTWFETDLTTGKALAVCFLGGFLVRSIPEVLAFPHPIGFDTVYYAVAMKNGVIWTHWSEIFTSTWLFNAIMILLYSVSKTDPFLLLKLAAPALYGLNVTGMFWFARKALDWSVKWSLLASALFSIQLASIRISWDLLRNTLGMGLLLIALPFAYNPRSRRDFVLLGLLSLLVVFAHEYSAVTLLAIVSGLLCWRVLRRRLTKTNVWSLLASMPAASIFIAGIFLRIFPTRYTMATNVVDIGDTSSGRFLFFANYLSVKDGIFNYPTYWWLAVDVLVLFALLYLSYFYLVWKGFFRHSILSLWLALLLVGTFGCLVVPFFALDLWDRWMFMLAYPFTFYAANGLRRLREKHNSARLQQRHGALTTKMVAMFIVTSMLGFVYLATPVLMSTVNAGVFSVYPAYVHFSFAPTVPYEDVDGMIQAMSWLNTHMDSDSCVVLHHAFFQWGQLYLDKTHEIIHFTIDVNLAVNVGVDHGFSKVYFVWWNVNIGWYGVRVPDDFARVQDFGRMSVYSYAGESNSGS